MKDEKAAYLQEPWPSELLKVGCFFVLHAPFNRSYRLPEGFFVLQGVVSTVYSF